MAGGDTGPAGLGGGPGLAAAATYLGLTQAELQTALQSGKTLAQIANATDGKSAAGLIDALVAAEKTKLAAAVTAGKLTQAQADEISTTLKDHVTNMVNGVRPAHDGPAASAARGGTAASGAPPSGSGPSRATARTSRRTQRYVRKRARGRRPAAASPSSGRTAFHGLEHMGGDGSAQRHVLAIARAWARDSLVVSLR